MKSLLIIAGVISLFSGVSAPLQAAIPASKQIKTCAEEEASPGQKLLKVTNDLWFLLSGIADKEDADAAAPRFHELALDAVRQSDSLFNQEAKAQDLEALDMLQYRISEAFEDLNTEFESLCRTQCYGSQLLIRAFHQAADAGLFNDEELPILDTQPPLNEIETRHELVRMRRLVEPDSAVLDTLRAVIDARTAAKAVPRLNKLTDRLRQLQPEKKLANRAFAADSSASVKAAYAPIEPLLWGIRTEIVRIAALPGYDDAAYDAFSDALDTVYESLGATHSIWFNDVFDAYFRNDLDEAFHENITSKN